MKFAAILKSLLLLTAVSLLVACGGGSSGGDSVFQPPSIKITATPSASSAMPGQPVEVQVRVTNANGSAIADGTTVNATLSPSNSGAIRYAPTNGAVSESASGPTSGGIVNFRYTAGGSGNVTLTFSTTGTAGTATTNATVSVSGTGDYRLQMTATRTQLPVNLYAVHPFLGSPYMSEVTVTVRDGNGQPVNMPNGIQVSINPIDPTGGFSYLDDPETECEDDDIPWEGCNEFLTRVGQAPVDVVAGKATIFVHSLQSTGTTTLTITTLDAVSNQTITATQGFQIVTTTPPLPTLLSLQSASGAIYVQDSGGNSSGLLLTKVLDALGQPVPEPVAAGTAYNNYRLEIVGATGANAPRLNGVNAAGVSVSGQAISLRTTAGIGEANFLAGRDVGSYVVRLTADRADNNVDNGISDPVQVEISVVVSDGRLFDLEITMVTDGPFANGIEVSDIPGARDGTYSKAVGVIATDRLGNPVLPGTQIRFGLIDEPQATGTGDFYIAGGDGDPQEGGVLFTSANGSFRTAGGGAGPGDTLVVMAEDVVGNRDMESARVVRTVHSETSLSVDYRFNHNDTTGQSVDYRGILPYVIGRPADANVNITAETNNIGVAVTRLNYSAGVLGKTAIIWAQGDGPVVAGQPKKITDVEYVRLPGVAPGSLVVSPSVLPANTTQSVTVCLFDALGVPVGGESVAFAFENLAGSGWVDDIANSGSVNDMTAFGSGCTVATVRTSGMLEAEGEAALVFSVGSLTGEVEFSFQPLVLLANPSSMTSGGSVVLTLLNGNGLPQAGFQLVGTCTSSGGAAIGIASGPGITNALGRTTAVIDAFNLNQVGGSGSGECTFSTADGSASAVVTLEGSDMCTWGISPPVAGCPTETVEQFTLNAVIQSGSIAGSYGLTSNPSGVICSTAASTSFPCGGVEFDSGVTVILTATGPAGAVFDRWEGNCVAVGSSGGAERQATVIMSGNRTCSAFWQ